MQSDCPHWNRMWFKKNKVWVATRKDGTPRVKNGKCLIKYQLNQSYEYWVYPGHLRPLEEASGKLSPQAASANHYPAGKPTAASDNRLGPDLANTIRIYTDGASSGNPGPAGIGIVLNLGEYEREISRYIGIATNNIAELEAIRVSINELKRKDVPVRIFTDSNYAYGLLMLGWKPKKNQTLVADIKKRMAAFKDLKIVKIKGHAGLAGNERADRLAVRAIKKRQK